MLDYYPQIAILTALYFQVVIHYGKKDCPFWIVIVTGMIWPIFWSFIVAEIILKIFSNSRKS